MPENSDIIIKRGYVIPNEKGMGSACGGQWKPQKPEDYRLVGTPGEIKISYQRDGTKVETKIGDDGYAVRERHHTSAPNPKYHSNPHDHEISWTTPRFGCPNFGQPINYWDSIPEFKGEYVLNPILKDIFSNNFKTQSDFVNCVIRGGEPVFTWNGIQYGICFVDNRYCIAHIDGSNEQIYEEAEALLDYSLGKDRLRDVITEVCVISRNI